MFPPNFSTLENKIYRSQHGIKLFGRRRRRWTIKVASRVLGDARQIRRSRLYVLGVTGSGERYLSVAVVNRKRSDLLNMPDQRAKADRYHQEAKQHRHYGDPEIRSKQRDSRTKDYGRSANAEHRNGQRDAGRIRKRLCLGKRRRRPDDCPTLLAIVHPGRDLVPASLAVHRPSILPVRKADSGSLIREA